MATVTITVPDNQAARIVAAFAYGSPVKPETMAEGIELVQKAVFEWLRDQTLLYEAQMAREAVLTNQDDPLVSAVITQSEG